MIKVFEKRETLFCMLLIALYLAVNFVCVQLFGETSIVSFIANTVLSLLLLSLMLILKRTAYYGLTKVENVRKYLYFFPLLIIISVNLWNGFNMTRPAEEIIIHILTMINNFFLCSLLKPIFNYRSA